MSKDISNMLPGSVTLEKNALDAFGAAVENKSQKLSIAPSTGSTGINVMGEDASWISSDFAAHLVKTNTVPFNPKLKFMFKVSFKFNPAMIAAAEEMGHPLKDLQEDITFLVRHVDRPKHDFDFEEVNMYNFRTKILKSIRHREVSLTVYDDVGNTALSFVNVYRKLLQPIARRQFMPGMAHEDYGFSFGGLEDTSLRSVLPGGAKTIFEEMTIHQIFVERGSDVSNPSAWVKVVNFVFMNPKFTNIDVDDMDHENGGNFNIITFSVDFDSVYMDHPQSFNAETGGPSFKGGDIPNGGSGGNSAQGKGRISTQNFRDFASPTFTGLSDGGATSVEQTKRIDGALQEAGQKSVKGLLSNTKQSIARPSSSLLVDNTSPPSTVQSLTSREQDIFLSDDFGDYV